MKKIDRTAEFPQLRDGEVYADWTGAALPPVSLISKFATFLTSHLLGNPHSSHRASQTASDMVTATRARILSYLNASSDEYDVVFTPNATGAIRILEHFVFRGGELLLTADNHNSVNGLRETARRDGGVMRYAPINDDLTIDEDALVRMLDFARTDGNKLFAYPAKSNYSGTLHPLEFVEMAQKRGWYVLLDAAAYNANCRLDLSVIKPDFVPVSFYKMFGFPTGVGALLVRKDVFARMDKRWFAGGTILLVSVMADFYALEPAGPARFEDGTVNFQMMPAVTRGLRWLDTLGDRKVHANAIARTLRDGLLDLRVGDNSIRVHSPPDTSVVTFSVLRTGETVNAWEVEHAADEVGIHVRTGCFCNPGANERTMGYTVNEFEVVYNDGASANDFTLEKLREHSGGKPIGAIRASFGYANTLEDAHRILGFLREYLGSL